MSVGVLIVTHNDLGSALLETATRMLGCSPLVAETLAVRNDCDVDLLNHQASAMAADLDQGDGVLVLADMFGSTPGNIACRLEHPGRVEVITGVNLPMLVRIFNYAQFPLEELAEKAYDGGRAGVLRVCPQEDRFG